MPCIVNGIGEWDCLYVGEVKEKEELGFVSSIIAFFLSVYTFIVDL